MSFLSLNAQNNAETDTITNNIFDDLKKEESNYGKVNLYQPFLLDEYILIHKKANKRHNGIDGYRIQLYLGSGRNAKKSATHIMAQLLENFPDEKYYMTYSAPFWRVQIGNFRSKNESMKLYEKLKKYYPNCYPVFVKNIPLSVFDNKKIKK